MEKLLIPINVSFNHWVLAVVEIGTKKIKLLDSMRKRIPKRHILKNLLKFLKKEHQARKGTALSAGWRLLDVDVLEVPKQINGKSLHGWRCQ